MGTIRNGVRLYEVLANIGDPVKDRAEQSRTARRNGRPEDFGPPMPPDDAAVIVEKLRLGLLYGDYGFFERAIATLRGWLAGVKVRDDEYFVADLFKGEPKTIEKVYAALPVLTLRQLTERYTLEDLADSGIGVRRMERMQEAARASGLRWKA